MKNKTATAPSPNQTVSLLNPPNAKLGNPIAENISVELLACPCIVPINAAPTPSFGKGKGISPVNGCPPTLGTVPLTTLVVVWIVGGGTAILLGGGGGGANVVVEGGGGKARVL